MPENHLEKAPKSKKRREKKKISRDHSFYLYWESSGDKFISSFVVMPHTLDCPKVNNFFCMRHIFNYSDSEGKFFSPLAIFVKSYGGIALNWFCKMHLLCLLYIGGLDKNK